MAFYADDEEAWKCLKHPSKRRRTGVCATCLRERLSLLCTECANLRPCECCPPATGDATSSSPFSIFSRSTSTSFSFFSRSASVSGGRPSGGIGDVGRVSNLLDTEPTFRKSRSVSAFLRGRFYDRAKSPVDPNPTPARHRHRSAFLSVFRSPKMKHDIDVRSEGYEVNCNSDDEVVRSGSVGVSITSKSGGGFRARIRRWHFRSPIKAFRHSSATKTSKVVQERSPLPLYRG